MATCILKGKAKNKLAHGFKNDTANSIKTNLQKLFLDGKNSANSANTEGNSDRSFSLEGKRVIKWFLKNPLENFSLYKSTFCVTITNKTGRS